MPTSRSVQAPRRRTVTLAGARPTEDIAKAPGVRDLRVGGRRVHLTATGSLAEVMKVAAAHQLDDIVTHEADLEELFLAQ